jgi:[ribosomal protein S5]-alanine N-acetyltransferase
LNSISTNRLELVSIGSDLIEALLAEDYKRAEGIGGFYISDNHIFSKFLLEMRLKQMQLNPDVQPWLLRAIIIKQSQTMCGRIGFHSAPNPDDLQGVAVGGVEIGYAISEDFRKQGYAKEAALALMKWAFKSYNQRYFILSIAPDNEASLAMAHSMGFKEIGSHIDEDDGLELYFEKRLTNLPEK